MSRHDVGKTRIPESLLRQMLRGIADDEGVSANLVESVAEVESTLDANAVSPKGARGVMQVMPDSFTLKGLNMPEGSDIDNTNDNIRAGSRLLKSAIEKWGKRLDLVLAEYNLGRPKLIKALEHGHLPQETTNYIERVTKKFLAKQP